MTKAQIIRTAALTAIILAIVVALDFLVNVVLMPGVTAYTPLATAGIVVVVAPPFIAYLILQHAKVQKAMLALAEERVARLAADGANAAKTQFLANMSHELRTPLNAIIGYAEIIEEEGQDGIAADSQRIQRSAHHLLGLISEILDHAKLEAGEVRLAERATELRPIFDEVVQSVRRAAEKNGTEVTAECDAEIGSAWIDELRVKQCMLNVANNAAKFTKGGRISLLLRADADFVTFEVVDTGIGMTEQTLSRLFQPFVQADTSVTRAYGGTGLGLVITKQLMDSMGGSVSVKSTHGVGSTFTIRFRRAPQRPHLIAA